MTVVSANAYTRRHGRTVVPWPSIVQNPSLTITDHLVADYDVPTRLPPVNPFNGLEVTPRNMHRATPQPTLSLTGNGDEKDQFVTPYD